LVSLLAQAVAVLVLVLVLLLAQAVAVLVLVLVLLLAQAVAVLVSGEVSPTWSTVVSSDVTQPCSLSLLNPSHFLLGGVGSYCHFIRYHIQQQS